MKINKFLGIPVREPENEWEADYLIKDRLVGNLYSLSVLTLMSINIILAGLVIALLQSRGI